MINDPNVYDASLDALTHSEICLGDWCVLMGYRGSIAHSMYLPDTDPNSVDDKDVMAVCIPPVEYYLGLRQFGSRGTQEIKWGAWDIVVYEARKFISLLAQGNPNVLSILWLNPKHYLKITGCGRALIEHRDVFVGKHVYGSFVGYAKDQLRRMTHGNTEGYMGARRKALVEKYGFDIKNASCVIRLLRMAVEFLDDGVLRVEREDAQELLEIKRGEWSLDRVKAEADILFRWAESAYNDSKLPPQPNMDSVNELAVDVISEWLYPREW